jgi:hypothetical protein
VSQLGYASYIYTFANDSSLTLLLNRAWISDSSSSESVTASRKLARSDTPLALLRDGTPNAAPRFSRPPPLLHGSYRGVALQPAMQLLHAVQSGPPPPPFGGGGSLGEEDSWACQACQACLSRQHFLRRPCGRSHHPERRCRCCRPVGLCYRPVGFVLLVTAAKAALANRRMEEGRVQ